MKKGIVVALALVLGATAYAATLGVPWFMDNAPAFSGLPPNTAGICGMVFLHNNMSYRMECSIEYFTQLGDTIGPASNNTFGISPKASIGFRPVAYDPGTTPGGQESAEAAKVPDRPSGTVPPNDGKKNGSLVISWTGGDKDVQGFYMQGQTATQNTSSSNTTPLYKLMGFAHLLPPGL